MSQDQHVDRETDTRLESKLIRASASLPFPGIDSYYLFFFLFLNERQDRDRINGPKRQKHKIFVVSSIHDTVE